MRIALAQIDIEWENAEANLGHALTLVMDAVQQKCDVIVFPELFTSGFSMNTAPITAGPSLGDTIQTWAGEHRIAIVAGIPRLAQSGKGLNTAIACDKNGRLVTSYDKLHPFSLLEEQKYYEPGTTTTTFELAGAASSIFICYDLRFPESFRQVAPQIDIIYIIANWPASRVEHWDTLLKARAIENQCYVVAVNRVGTDPHNIEYAGHSCVFDPTGNLTAQANATEQLLVIDIDPDLSKRTREAFPFLKDIRPMQ